MNTEQKDPLFCEVISLAIHPAVKKDVINKVARAGFEHLDFVVENAGSDPYIILMCIVQSSFKSKHFFKDLKTRFSDTKALMRKDTRRQLKEAIRDRSNPTVPVKRKM